MGEYLNLNVYNNSEDVTDLTLAIEEMLMVQSDKHYGQI